MRQGNGGDTEGTERGQMEQHLSQRGRAGSKASAAAACGSANIEVAEVRGAGAGGSARGEDHITLRTSKRNIHTKKKRGKKRRKTQDDSLRSCAAAQSNESN